MSYRVWPAGRTRRAGPMINSAKPIDSRCARRCHEGFRTSSNRPAEGRTARPTNSNLLVVMPRQRIDRDGVVVVVDCGEVEAGVGVERCRDLERPIGAGIDIVLPHELPG
jgi:hypothetical protein